MKFSAHYVQKFIVFIICSRRQPFGCDGHWLRINYLPCPRSFVKSIAPLSLSPSNVMLSFILTTSVVLVCLCFFFLRILSVMHCVDFGQLAFFLHFHTIGVFVETLSCRAL